MKKITLSVLFLLVITSGFTQNILTIEFRTDRWASESAWGVFDSAGTLIAQNATLANTTTISTDINVSATECYHFVLIDSYGDGVADDGGSSPGFLNIYYNGTIVGGFTTAESNFGSRLDIYGLGEGCPDVDANLSKINNNPFDSVGDVNVSCTIQNTGLNNLTSFDVNYQIDDTGAIVTQNFSGVNMAIGDSNVYTFTTPWNVSAPGTYDLHVWVSNANGAGVDGNSANDSKNKNIGIASQLTQRLPLYEEFTSSTCAPCASFNANSFNTDFLTTNAGNFSLIKYQMNWPGAGDPYYTAEGGLRRVYYNVTGVPTLVFDGDAKNPDFFQNPSQLQPELTSHYSRPAYFTMNAIHAFRTTTNTVDVEVDVDAYLSGEYKMYAAVVEGTTTGNIATNGETSFTNVMMKMVPDANGTVVNFVDGVHQNVNLSASLDGTNIEDMNDLKVVVYIQHDDSGIIMQSTNSVEDNTAKANNYIFNTVSLYPNPSNGIFKVKTDRSLQLSIIDMLGRKVYSNNEVVNDNTIDLSGMSKGFYMVNISDGTHTGTQKIILQ